MDTPQRSMNLPERLVDVARRPGGQPSTPVGDRARREPADRDVAERFADVAELPAVFLFASEASTEAFATVSARTEPDA